MTIRLSEKQLVSSLPRELKARFATYARFSPAQRSSSSSESLEGEQRHIHAATNMDNVCIARSG